jgi:hypothetical protein
MTDKGKIWAWEELQRIKAGNPHLSSEDIYNIAKRELEKEGIGIDGFRSPKSESKNS